MRTFLSVDNLRKAAILGGAVAVMAIPRIVAGGQAGLYLRIAAIFPVMIIVAGAATAWGASAGMVGVFPRKERMLQGVCLAALAVVVVLPLQLWIEPRFAMELRRVSDANVVDLAFPATIGGALALLLWSASFETLFFNAAVVSFAARLTGRQWIAVLFAVGFRTALGFASLSRVGATSMIELKVAALAAGATISCLLFARYGLPAVMTFAAGLGLRHLARVVLPGEDY